MADQLFASISGTRIKSCTLVLPFTGRWTADLTTDVPVTVNGQVTLVLAGMSLLGTVYRSGDFLGSSQLRIMGGFGGWMNTLAPKPYQVATGVRLGTVLFDAAREVGEKINILTDRNLGASWTRRGKAPAARLLAQLVDQQWWIDPVTGITQIGPRPNPTIKSAFDVLGADLGLGKITIASDTPGDWQPGVMFSAPTLPGSKQVNTVIHTLDKNSLRTEIWLQ